MNYNYNIVNPNDNQFMQATVDNIVDALKIEGEIAKNTRAAVDSNMEKTRIIIGAMTEIRLALNFPMVDPNQNSLGDKIALTPMFSADHITELQIKYIQLSTCLVNFIDPPKPEEQNKK